jgi:hypothetical protein
MVAGVLDRLRDLRLTSGGIVADWLKENYDLVALKVEFAPAAAESATGGDKEVAFTLQYHMGQALVIAKRWQIPLQDIVQSRSSETSKLRSYDRDAFSIPGNFLMDLAAWFDNSAHEGKPLWIHLVKPYGVLRFVPWERLLGSAICAPILMLPDFTFPPPREASSVLEVAVCATMRQIPASILSSQIVKTAAQLFSIHNRRIRIHIFTDATSFDAPQLQAIDPRHEILIYSTATASTFLEGESASGTPRGRSVRSPWLLWMRNALAKRSVDVVHFICNGFLTRERGAILLSPRSLENSSAAVFSAELNTFLTQIGAWSTVFTSLPENLSEPGLRSLADELAQVRPGPLMMYTSNADPNEDALGAGYRFLYSKDRRPAPRSKALFLYCQPYLSDEPISAAGLELMSGEGAVEFTPSDSVRQEAEMRPRFTSPLERYFSQEENASTLVASTERFAEEVQLQFQRLARSGIVAGGSADERQMRTTLDTVDQLREAVAAHLGPQTGEI